MALEAVVNRLMTIKRRPDYPARYDTAWVIAKDTWNIKKPPFGIRKAHFAAMSYRQNQHVLNSFWNYSWFPDLLEKMYPAEILSALYGSDFVKNREEFRQWSEKNLARLFWEREMNGLDRVVKNERLVGLIGEGVYALVRRANVWGYLSSIGVDGMETLSSPIIFALQKMARKSGLDVEPGDEKKRVVEAAMSNPEKAFRLITSALEERVYSNGENRVGFRYTVIDADGGLPNKRWYVNRNYRLLKSFASTPQLIKAAAS